MNWQMDVGSEKLNFSLKSFVEAERATMARGGTFFLAL